jgi:hypothetical protein
MTPIQMCIAALQAEKEKSNVLLTIPKGKTPKGFPRAIEVLNEIVRNGHIERTSMYDPLRVIAWLVRNNLVKMKSENNTITFSEIEQTK